MKPGFFIDVVFIFLAICVGEEMNVSGVGKKNTNKALRTTVLEDAMRQKISTYLHRYVGNNRGKC